MDNTISKQSNRGCKWRLPSIGLPLVFMSLVILSGCQTLPPIHTVSSVDLDRFMGDWYVIASIPTIFEKGAFIRLGHYFQVKNFDLPFDFIRDLQGRSLPPLRLGEIRGLE